jgi:zinc transporter
MTKRRAKLIVNYTNFLYRFSPEGFDRKKATQTTISDLGEMSSYWLHIGEVPRSFEQTLRKKMKLPNFVAENLCAEETRPRSVVTDDGMLIILRGVNLTPGASPDDMVSIRMWLTAKGLVTITMHPVHAVIDTEGEIATGGVIKSPIDVMFSIIEYLLYHIEDAIYSLDTSLDGIEEEIDTVAVDDASKTIGAIRQQIIGFRRYLLPQREAILRLPNERLTWLSPAQLMQLRDLGDSMSRYVEDLDAARERASVLQDNLFNRLTERVNGKMYVLSIIALIFMPASFLTGLFGMNIVLPGQTSTLTFWLVCSAIVISTTSLVMIFRRKKWM